VNSRLLVQRQKKHSLLAAAAAAIALIADLWMIQILYKDSEHADGAVVEQDTTANTDDGGAFICCIPLLCWLTCYESAFR